jgi:hypothetical protein
MELADAQGNGVWGGLSSIAMQQWFSSTRIKGMMFSGRTSPLVPSVHGRI